jgi:hypothetical protein
MPWRYFDLVVWWRVEKAVGNNWTVEACSAKTCRLLLAREGMGCAPLWVAGVVISFCGGGSAAWVGAPRASLVASDCSFSATPNILGSWISDSVRNPSTGI